MLKTDASATLRNTRWRQGLTLAALAERSGVSVNTIHRVEQGTVAPRGQTIFALAAALDLDPLALLEEEETA